MAPFRDIELRKRILSAGAPAITGKMLRLYRQLEDKLAPVKRKAPVKTRAVEQRTPQQSTQEAKEPKAPKAPQTPQQSADAPRGTDRKLHAAAPQARSTVLLDLNKDRHKERRDPDEFCYKCLGEENLRPCCAADCYSSVCAVCVRKGLCVSVFNVGVACLQCVTNGPISTEYRHKPEDATKRECNASFVRRVVSTKNRPHVLLLDDGTTTSRIAEACRRYGARATVHVPNPDRTALAAAVSGARGSPVDVWASSARVSRWLVDAHFSGTPKLTCAWIDYCGTFDGNDTTGVFPREDVRRIWENCLDRTAKRVFVAFTFSKRNARTSQQDVIDEILETASLNKWSDKVDDLKTYGNMFFVMFKAQSK